MQIEIVGTGRAGRALHRALADVGHDVTMVSHGAHEVASTCDLVILALPDDVLAANAATLRLAPNTVIAHVSATRDLDVLAPHARRGSMHPLAVLADEEPGAGRLRGATYLVDGDTLVREVVASLGGRAVTVAPEHRARYHATAVVAANHVATLLGHVETLAHSLALDPELFFELSAQTLDDVRRVGAAAALTGPARRGDHETLRRHLANIPSDQREAYRALARAAAVLGGATPIASEQ